ncbi:MAG: class I SAM-dependent methyltransferase [bacterium]
MKPVEKKIMLAAPPGDVWSFITDPAHFGDYVEGYAHGEVLSGNAVGPGSAFRWKAPLGPLRVGCEERVVEWDEGERVTYEGRAAGAGFRSEMRVKPVGTGAELTVGIAYDVPPGPAGAALDSLFIRRTVEDHVSRSLENLRRVFEGAESPRKNGAPSGISAVRSMYSMWGGTGMYDAAAALTFMFRGTHIRRRAVAALELKKGARVLDLCCGTGLNFAPLRRAAGAEGAITGLDYTRAMLDRAEARRDRRRWNNVTLVQGDAARLCFPDGCFDGVISVLGISAVTDFVPALAHAVRVCRNGGRVVVCDGHPFEGRLKPLNPLMVPVYRRLACWDSGKDVIGELRNRLSGFGVEWFNGGSIYVASGTKTTARRGVRRRKDKSPAAK